MKILFFIESLRSGGKERRLVELLKGLKSTHPEIQMELVLTRKDIHYTDVLNLDIPIHVIERKGIKKDPRLFFLFYRICKKYKPNIIHVWGNMPAIYAIPAKVLLHIPMINNQITDAPLQVKGGLLSHKLTFPFSDLIISNSIAGLKSYNAPKKKSIVIYNGFNFNRIKDLKNSLDIRKQFNIKTKCVIGMVASFSDKKDYETYINAANKVLNNNKDITFLCIGAGDDSYFKKIATQENIKFLGRQENVESIMNICDIGILSTYTEGVSNSIMEFMALGKPVIATDGGGTGELVIDRETGFLVKPKSVEELSSKIEFLIKNVEIAIEMGIKGKYRIRQEFSMKEIIYKFIESYENVLKKHQNI